MPSQPSLSVFRVLSLCSECLPTITNADFQKGNESPAKDKGLLCHLCLDAGPHESPMS